MYVVRDLSKNAQHGVLLSVARVWDMRDIVSTFRKMSTKPDQAQRALATRGGDPQLESCNRKRRDGVRPFSVVEIGTGRSARWLRQAVTRCGRSGSIGKAQRWVVYGLIFARVRCHVTLTPSATGSGGSG